MNKDLYLKKKTKQYTHKKNTSILSQKI